MNVQSLVQTPKNNGFESAFIGVISEKVLKTKLVTNPFTGETFRVPVFKSNYSSTKQATEYQREYTEWKRKYTPWVIEIQQKKDAERKRIKYSEDPEFRAKKAKYNKEVSLLARTDPHLYMKYLKRGGDASKTNRAGASKSRKLLSVDYMVEVWKAQDNKCAYSGLEMTMESGALNVISLDRIDSSLGYIEGNICFTCRAVNIGKMDKDYIEYTSMFFPHNLENAIEMIEKIKQIKQEVKLH